MNAPLDSISEHPVPNSERSRIRIELCERMSERIRRVASIGGSSPERAIITALRNAFGDACNSEGTT